MELTINKEIQGDTIVFKFKGIIDISTAHIIDSYLDEIGNIKTLIYDFYELDFIDSTGIGSIMNSIYLSQEKQFSLQFQGLNELTHEVFETIGLFQILAEIQKEVS